MFSELVSKISYVKSRSVMNNMQFDQHSLLVTYMIVVSNMDSIYHPTVYLLDEVLHITIFFNIMPSNHVKL